MNKEQIKNFLDGKKVIELPKKLNHKEDEEFNLFTEKENISSNNEKSEITNEFKNSEVSSTVQKTSSKKERVKHSAKSAKRQKNSSMNRRIISSNDRKPVYVGIDREVDEKQQNKSSNAKKIGDRGENYILDNENYLLLSSENHFEKAPTNNKGFDIYEKDKSGKLLDI